MRTLPDLYKRRRWTVNGYHAFPLTANDVGVPNYEKWVEFDELLGEAKSGDFRRIPVLVDWIADADDWVLCGQYVKLLGDAGSNQTLNHVLNSIPVGQDIALEFYYADILIFWGHLSTIPMLIDMYERYSFSEDSMYLAAGLSRLMEEAPGDIGAFPMDESEDEVIDYCQMVRQKYKELCDRLGTDDAFVFRGDVVEVKNICQRMLDDLNHKHRFHGEMRHKFEATTGIDCSAFYVDGGPQPLAVASILGEFLESPEAEGYEKGVRYFFGHRIPDRG